MRLTILTFVLLAQTAAASIVFDPGTYEVEITGESAAYADVNELYLYPEDTPGDLTLLFAGTAGVGDSVSFEAPVAFGLALHSPDDWFFSQPEFSGDGLQHFLLFGGSQIRIEDLWILGDRDFNDMQLQYTWSQPDPTPESETWILMAIGLTGVGLIRARGLEG